MTDGSASGHFPSTPKAHFKPAYFEAIDLITNCVQERFDQPCYRIYRSLETLLIKVSKQEEFQESLDDVCAFYHDAHSQLQTFGIHFQTVEEPAVEISIFDLKRYSLTWTSLSSFTSQTPPAVDTCDASNYSPPPKELPEDNHGTRAAQSLDGHTRP